MPRLVVRRLLGRPRERGARAGRPRGHRRLPARHRGPRDRARAGGGRPPHRDLGAGGRRRSGRRRRRSAAAARVARPGRRGPRPSRQGALAGRPRQPSVPDAAAARADPSHRAARACPRAQSLALREGHRAGGDGERGHSPPVPGRRPRRARACGGAAGRRRRPRVAARPRRAAHARLAWARRRYPAHRAARWLPRHEGPCRRPGGRGAAGRGGAPRACGARRRRRHGSRHPDAARAPGAHGACLHRGWARRPRRGGRSVRRGALRSARVRWDVAGALRVLWPPAGRWWPAGWAWSRRSWPMA